LGRRRIVSQPAIAARREKALQRALLPEPLEAVREFRTFLTLVRELSNKERKRLGVRAIRSGPASTGSKPTLRIRCCSHSSGQYALRDQIDPTIAAISTMMIVVTTVLFALTQVFGKSADR
jgi:hypothetical protein